MDIAEHHKNEWERCVYDACGDHRIALRVTALAEMNGLFDPHRYIERLRADRKTVYEWMREPDFVENASLDWLMDWINRRPTAQCRVEQGADDAAR